MEPSVLRFHILQLIEQHEASGTSQLLGDKVMAERLNIAIVGLQRQLNILQGRGLVKLTKKFGPTYDAELTPQGMEALEAAATQSQEPAARRIGF